MNWVRNVFTACVLTMTCSFAVCRANLIELELASMDNYLERLSEVNKLKGLKKFVNSAITKAGSLVDGLHAVYYEGRFECPIVLSWTQQNFDAAYSRARWLNKKLVELRNKHKTLVVSVYIKCISKKLLKLNRLVKRLYDAATLMKQIQEDKENIGFTKRRRLV